MVIGIGGFGLLALREMRCRLTDRMGDLRQAPAFRFLYLDSDPEARSTEAAGVAGRALAPEQVFPTPLQPVTRYRRRQLDHARWLPREKLYAIPRSLHAAGVAGPGPAGVHATTTCGSSPASARELEIATHPESLTRSADQTGLSAARHPAAGVRLGRGRRRVVRGAARRRVRRRAGCSTQLKLPTPR